VLAVSKHSKFVPQKKILFVKFLRLDFDLCKTTEIEILEEMANRGHAVCLMAVSSRKLQRVQRSKVRVITIPIPYTPIFSHVAFAAILLLFLPIHISLSRPDFVITDPSISVLGFLSTIPFSVLKKTKLVLDIRSIPVETFGFRGFLQNLSFAVSVLAAKKFFDGMTIITDPMKRELCDKFGLNSDRIGVWSSGVSVQSFDPKNYVSERAIFRQRFRLENKFVILYHGAFRSTGGLVETIEAISLVSQVYPDVTLFLLGRGNIPDLKKLIIKNELRSNVIVHDPVEYTEVPKYVAMCDVGIVPLPNTPYWRYQCPLKLLEYSAMEKVVIATDIPAHRAVIGEEKCGIYISSVEPVEIAKAIEYAYFNRENLKEWGKVGRKIMKEKYTWERVARDLEGYLLSMNDRANLV
jgi:glycosyltransferase involved in cell wall biosynthesis